MEQYVFRARNQAGKVKNGNLTAESLRIAEKQLEDKGLDLIFIRPKDRFWDRFLVYTIRVRDRSMFYKQLATMLHAGVPITQSVDITAQTPNQYFKRILSQISDGLGNGFPLSRCLANYPKLFPEIELGVIKAGEATGKMEMVLKELAEETARSAAFISKVRNAMIYPVFIFVVLIAVAIIMIVKIVPTIQEIFEDAKVALPWTTKLLLAISDLIIYKWYYLLGGIIVLAAALKLFGTSSKGKRIYSYFRLNFPVFGPLMRQVYLARFNQTFSMLLKAGVPIIETVHIIETMTTNVLYQEIIAKLAHSLEQGAPVTTGLQSNKYFPGMMVQMLYVGQQAGDLAGMCSTLAEYYTDEVENQLKTFSSLLEPFIIVLVAIAVGFVIVSILMPIYNLTNIY